MVSKHLGIVIIVAACGARTALDDGRPDASIDSSIRDAGADVVDEKLGCASGDITLVAASPEVMFVLDRSGSMRTAFEGDETRWEVLTTALASALPPVDQTMQVGALLFPQGTVNIATGVGSCAVATKPDLAPAFGNVNALVNLMQTTAPGGGTPTADAIDTAASYLLGLRAAAAARSIILATDGSPNCNAALDGKTCVCPTDQCGNPTACLDDARTVQHIAEVLAQGIPTYVIGIANDEGDEFTTVLNAMASAGGRPLTGGATSYYPALDASDLDTAITTIRNQVAECTYLTTSVPDVSGSIVVTLNGQTLPFAGDAGTVGWSWADESNGEITLVGSTCADLAADAGISLVAHVECGSGAD